MRLDQQRAELRAAPFVAAGRERAERVAVIALAAGDDVAPLRLARLDEILPRHLERRLDRFRAAGDEIGVADALRRVRRSSLSASASAGSLVKKLVWA